MSKKLQLLPTALGDFVSKKAIIKTIEEAMTFHPDTTQYEEVVLLLKRACGAADEIERRLLAHDADINLDDE